MDFTPTPDMRSLGEAVAAAITRHGSPAAETGAAAAPSAHDAALWSALVEVGAPGLSIATDDGGLGAGIIYTATTATELGRARVHTPLAETTVAAAILARTASPEVRGPILTALSEGSALPLPALAEPMRTWSATPAEVTAASEGDSWALSGVKAPVRYAPAATHFIVTARITTSAAAEAKGEWGLFLVEGHASTTEEVSFDHTPAALLASGEAAQQALDQAIAAGGAVLCAESLGAMEEALRLTTEYLRTRTQFGKPLAAFQALTHRAADMYAQLELARSASLFAAMIADEEQIDVDAITRSRVVVDKAGRAIGQEAIQMHGGIGVTAEHPVGHLTARLTMISRTWGTPTARLTDLGRRISDHSVVDVLG